MQLPSSPSQSTRFTCRQPYRTDHILHLGVPDPPTDFRLLAGEAVPPDTIDPADLVEPASECVEEAIERVDEASELEEYDALSEFGSRESEVREIETGKAA